MLGEIFNSSVKGHTVDLSSVCTFQFTAGAQQRQLQSFQSFGADETAQEMS